MRDCLQLKQMCSIWLMALWSASAFAAQATFATDLSSIPLGAVAVAAVIALIGGSAATMARIADPGTVIHHMTKEVIRDILASLVVGMVTFFACAWKEISPFPAAGAIFIAGYGGSRVLERYLVIGINQIDRLGGKPEGTP